MKTLVAWNGRKESNRREESAAQLESALARRNRDARVDGPGPATAFAVEPLPQAVVAATTTLGVRAVVRRIDVCEAYSDQRCPANRRSETCAVTPRLPGTGEEHEHGAARAARAVKTLSAELSNESNLAARH